jgi:hypothetical protein
MRGVGTRAFDAAAVAPEVEAVVDIDWPKFDSCPTPLDKTECLLQIAAEVEHALLIQYLYGAYSMALPEKDPRRKTFSDVAVEEMSHLMTVQNLLLAIGSPPYDAVSCIQQNDPGCKPFWPKDVANAPAACGRASFAS